MTVGPITPKSLCPGRYFSQYVEGLLYLCPHLTGSFWKTASCSLSYPHIRQGQAPLQVLKKHLWKERRKRGRERRKRTGRSIVYPLEKGFLLHTQKGNPQGMRAEGCWEWTWKAGLLYPVSKWEKDRT